MWHRSRRRSNRWARYCVEFYPSAPEKGVRSERALKLAIAEMKLREVVVTAQADLAEPRPLAQLHRLVQNLLIQASQFRKLVVVDLTLVNHPRAPHFFRSPGVLTRGV